MDREHFVGFRVAEEQLRRLRIAARAAGWGRLQAARFAIEHALDEGLDLAPRGPGPSQRLDRLDLPAAVIELADQEASRRGWDRREVAAAALVAGLGRVEAIADAIASVRLRRRERRDHTSPPHALRPRS